MERKNISEWDEREIQAILESDDEEAVDLVEYESDNESDPDYEPMSDDFFIDDEELLTTIETVETSQLNDPTEPSTSQGSLNRPKNSKKISPNVPQDTTQNLTEFVMNWGVENVCGKNEFIWATNPISPTTPRVKEKNIVHIKPGSANDARYANTPVECFKLFFSKNITDKILACTNMEIERVKSNYKCQTSHTIGNTCEAELLGLFGSLYYAASMRHNHLNSRILHNPVSCGDVHRAIMSESRFSFLLACLRFDCRETRSERKTKLAPISEIWDIFVDNCKKNYKPGSYLTIDEQLVAFRGKCPFRVYIPSKPNKYGMKIIMICDNSTKYMINAMPHLGKGSTPPNIPAATFITLELIQPVSGTNRQLTMDNWFTSIPLAKKLLEDHKITVIGTIRKDKRELPKEFTDLKYKNRQTNSSLFLFAKDVTAVSYKPTQKKLVSLISTIHDDQSVNNASGKPEIILNYNETKGAVDVHDRLCQDNNSGRKTKRWPLAFFYNMLNITAVNAYVIYLHNFYRNALQHQQPRQTSQKRSRSKRLQPSKKPLSRFEFFTELVQQLTEEWMKVRLTIPTLQNDVRQSIVRCLERAALGQPNAGGEGEQPSISECSTETSVVPVIKRPYCSVCSYKKKKENGFSVQTMFKTNMW